MPGPNTVKVVVTVALLPDNRPWSTTAERRSPCQRCGRRAAGGGVGLAAATTTVASVTCLTPFPSTVAVAEIEQVAGRVSA